MRPQRAWLLIIMVALLAWVQWTRWRGAPWSPSSPRAVREMLDLADVGAGDLVYDLGCGDGRVLIEAARRGARAIGVELDPVRAAWTRLRIASAGCSDRVQVLEADLFDVDVSDADVVVCYLLQWSNDLLAEKLGAELRPGARIVSNRWTLPGMVEAARGRGDVVKVYVADGGAGLQDRP